MGYRCDVIIFCQERLYKEIINKCKENNFEPNRIMREKDGNTYNYRLDWFWCKWYDDYPEIRAINRVLNLADEEEEGAMYDYKQLIIGEDNDTEIYEHGTTFSEVYVVPKILYDDVNYENYIEHIDYDYEYFYDLVRWFNEEWKGGLTEREIAVHANEYKESYYTSLSNGWVTSPIKELCERVVEQEEGGSVYCLTVNDMVNILRKIRY